MAQLVLERIISPVRYQVKCLSLTERFFNNDPGCLRGYVDDSRVDEITLRRLNLAANSDVPALLLDILEKAFHALKLRSVLQRAMCYTFLGPIAQSIALDMFDKCFFELGINALVHKDSLKIEANLTRVEKCEKGHFLSSLVDIDVWEYDGWIVATTG